MRKRYLQSNFSAVLSTGSIALSALVLAACEDVLNYGAEPTFRGPSVAAHQAGAAGRASGSGGTGTVYSAVHPGGSSSGGAFVEASVGVGVVTAFASGGAIGVNSANSANSGNSTNSANQAVQTIAPISGGATSLERGNLSEQVFTTTVGGITAGGGAGGGESAAGRASGGESAAGRASGGESAGGHNSGNAGNGTFSVGGGDIGGTAAAGAAAWSPDVHVEYSCSVDLARSWSDCRAPAVQLTALANGEGALTVDMSSHRVLRLVVEVENPRGFVLDIGDSYCNDAGGGDCNATYYDAELDVQETLDGSIPMVLYLNDSSVVTDESTSVLATYPGLFTRTGRTERTLYLADRRICVDGITQCWQDDALLRLAGSGTSSSSYIDEGKQSTELDNKWYIGLNRVIWDLQSLFRYGSGVRKLSLLLLP